MALHDPIVPTTLERSSPKFDSAHALSKPTTKTKEMSSVPAVIQDRVQSLRKFADKPGTFSTSQMVAAGFQYTGEGDTAACESCGLSIDRWTQDMVPWKIHTERSPNCPFVVSLKSSIPALARSSSSSMLTTNARNPSASSEAENPSKRQKLETNDSMSSCISLVEAVLIQQVRRRTFSHWPHRTIPSTAQMIEAGFFNCNVGDRVICIYCNLICQQWTPHTDDPCEVHKTLSPNCIFVRAKLIRQTAASIVIVNENTSNAISNLHAATAASNSDSVRSNEIVYTAACNPAYTEIPKRHATFATWPADNLPPVDDLVRAGFFYTGTKTIVTCFYCNGSLQNWGPNDNPMIEHARWFPHCAYAKQLCGDDLYRKIQESKRAQQERARATEAREKAASGATSATTATTTTSSSRQLLIPDESTLSRLVAARLDLPISQRLLDQNFKLSIIKRCWEDQLRLKQDDFMSDVDLFIACTILQKQIEHIDGKKENIVIPSIRMKQVREQNEARLREQASSSAPVPPVPVDAEMTTSSQESTTESITSSESMSKPTTPGSQGEVKTLKSIADQDNSANATPSNPCVLCLTEEKRLACIPCGHLATCVPCGHSLRSCPMCRREIEAFVRIYI